MLFRSIVLIALILGINLPIWASERLRVATEGAYPPFNFIDENKQPAGFDVDIAKALCDVLKVECEIIAVPWERLLADLDAGRYHMIIASMAETPERAPLAEFTDPYYRTLHAFIARSNSGFKEVTLATVRGKVLAAQRDTIQAAYLRQHYQDYATLKLTDTTPAAFEALVKGEADYVLADCLLSYSFIRPDAKHNLEIIGQTIPDEELSSLSHIQVQKGNLKLRDAINRALSEIKKDGTYSRISKNYFPFDIR